MRLLGSETVSTWFGGSDSGLRGRYMKGGIQPGVRRKGKVAMRASRRAHPGRARVRGGRIVQVLADTKSGYL